MVNIRQEKTEDINSIDYVNEQAFNQKTEADLVNNLRQNKAIKLSLVAETKGQVVGHILFSPVKVEPDNSNFNAVTLAPLAVLPAYQRTSIGSQLIRIGLEECRLLGHDLVFVVGHPEYYPRFGFVQAKSKGFDCEFEVPDEAWMLFELQERVLSKRGGTVYFQPEFREAM